MKKIKPLKIAQVLSIFLTAFLLSRLSHAFLTVNETAEILPDNYFKIGVAPQALLSSGGGFNIGAFVDAHLDDDLDGRVTAGGGETDFWAQASLKWVPFPDVDRQPAMGARAAIIYAREENDLGDNENLTGFQIAPLFSKKADTRYGNMIPYVAVPFTFFNAKSGSYTASQFTVGAEWFPEQDKHFGTEFNLNLKDSHSSFSVYFSFPFEQSIGYKKYE